MGFNDSIIYRLANQKDALNLAVLLWEHYEELSEVDYSIKDDYITACLEDPSLRWSGMLFLKSNYGFPLAC